jgi:hypothetical protein
MSNNVASVKNFHLAELGSSAHAVYFTYAEGMGYITAQGYIVMVREGAQDACSIITYGKLHPKIFSKGCLSEGKDFDAGGMHPIPILKIFAASSEHDAAVVQFDEKMKKAWWMVDKSIKDNYKDWLDWAIKRMKTEGIHLRKGEEPTQMDWWELPIDNQNKN